MKETPSIRMTVTSSLKKISTILMRNTSRVGVKGSITPVEGLYCKRPMSGVFRNIDPPPPHRPASYPRLWCGGEDTFVGWRRGRGSIVRKTTDAALYSM
jgi:hypothetical protein